LYQLPLKWFENKPFSQGIIMSDWNKRIIEEFRANEGRVGGHFANNTLLLLHTTGAKSGQPRINPLITMEDGDRLVIVASAAAAAHHPAWYYNLLANPNVEVEFGAKRFNARATVTEEPERTELYGKMEAVFPTFTGYKTQTSRTIPVVTLTRQS
jgi:deazaflavin-dependent oxidoreductase (nitroreductase family)